MRRYGKRIALFALSVIMLMAMAVPALAGQADEAAKHGLSVTSSCPVSGGGSGFFSFSTDQERVVQGQVYDLGDSEIRWSGDLSDVKMNQGWDRVKAKVAVKVWGHIKNYGDVPADSPLSGVFSFDFAGTEPTELDGGDYILDETWFPGGEWTIMVPSIPVEGHELGCFGYNFHTGDPGFTAVVHKWLSR